MAFNEVNLMIEDFYKLFYETEELILKQGIKCLTTTELHVIEAIGNDSLTMNELSDRLGITMGTATVAINKLTDNGDMFSVMHYFANDGNFDEWVYNQEAKEFSSALAISSILPNGIESIKIEKVLEFRESTEDNRKYFNS